MKTDAEAFKTLGYGLYAVTTRDGTRDNGMICNTIMQTTSDPARVVAVLNKNSLTHETIRATGLLNVNVLSQNAPFPLIEALGFHSGRDGDKLARIPFSRAANGLAVLMEHCVAFLSLRVSDYVDLGTHGMFICTVDEAHVRDGGSAMTYAHYLAHVKPRVSGEGQKGFVCSVCGYVHNGETLPGDFVCPWCGHDASAFSPL